MSVPGVVTNLNVFPECPLLIRMHTLLCPYVHGKVDCVTCEDIWDSLFEHSFVEEFYAGRCTTLSLPIMKGC